jgi:ADP-ribose pyrophosphatase YjhB (NUDIX family)
MYQRASLAGALVRLGVGVIVTDRQGQILLERRSDNGMWGLPGGGIEPGETVTDAALREVKEESGLVVSITGLLGVYSSVTEGRMVVYPDNGDRRHLVDVVVLADILSGTPTTSKESLELCFFPPTGLPTRIVPPAQAPLMDYVAGMRAIIA